MEQCPTPLPTTSLFSFWKPLLYFLSLWMCLFWIFHRHRIIHYVVFGPAPFTLCNVSDTHPCCTMNQYFLPFWCQILFHRMDTSRSIYFFISWQTLGCFWFVQTVSLSLSVKGEKDCICVIPCWKATSSFGVAITSSCDVPGS